MLVYISAPIKADSPEGEAANIARGRDLCEQVWALGHPAIWVGSLTEFMEPVPPRDVLLACDCEILLRCDAILFSDDWFKADGCLTEYACARDSEIPMHFGIDTLKAYLPEVDMKPTE